MTPPSPPGATPDAGHRDKDLPTAITRAHAWVLQHWPTSLRRRVAMVAVLAAVGAVAVSWIADLVGAAIDLGMLAYLGLMVVCWVGAGGALVPIPGVRPLSWIMIVHQGAVLSPPFVALLAALAMALGQSSYFVATRTGKEHHADRHGRDTAPQPGDSDPGGEDEPATVDAAAAPFRPPGGIAARSRALLDRGREVVARRMQHHPQRIIFLLSLVPNPLTTFATVTAAATNVPFIRFFAASLAGFLALTIALVVAGQGILLALGISG